MILFTIIVILELLLHRIVSLSVLFRLFCFLVIKFYKVLHEVKLVVDLEPSEGFQKFVFKIHYSVKFWIDKLLVEPGILLQLEVSQTGQLVDLLDEQRVIIEVLELQSIV